jgi:hypothetical protein
MAPTNDCNSESIPSTRQPEVQYSALFKPCYASRAGKRSDYNRIEQRQEEIAFTVDESHFCKSSFCVVLYWIINRQLIFVRWI